MTPIELLEDVKSRFSVLLYDDEKALLSQLRKALIFYQDKAGFISRYQYDEVGSSVELPTDFLARIAVKDARNQFVSSVPWVTERTLELTLSGDEITPITLIYMVNASRVDITEWQIPDTAYGLLADYLELLITIPNSERLRRVSAAGKFDTTDIPMNSDLAVRKTELEAAITSSRAIIPVVGIGG